MTSWRTSAPGHGCGSLITAPGSAIAGCLCSVA
jgi:hypothetical protein